MAVHKVPQDVEADDKFLGPLSFKQFLFGGGALISGYLMFLFISKGVWPLVILLVPFFVICAAFAFPWSKDQPTDIWLASRIRFMLVPHKRVWDQSGVKELVQITVPKREAHTYSDNLSQEEVRSRLSALATVVDTRGWAVKNASGSTDVDFSDRLIQSNQPVLETDEAIVSSTTDIMDEQKNPVAHQFDSMIQASEDKHRKDTLARIQEARENSTGETGGQTTASPTTVSNQSSKQPAQDFWFLNEQPAAIKSSKPSTPAAISVPPVIKKDDEEQLLQKVHKQQKQEELLKKHSHLKTVVPLSELPAAGSQSQPADDDQTPTDQSANASSTTPVDPAIMALANNDDLSVETLARQAQKDLADDDEVVIKLH